MVSPCCVPFQGTFLRRLVITVRTRKLRFPPTLQLPVPPKIFGIFVHFSAVDTRIKFSIFPAVALTVGAKIVKISEMFSAVRTREIPWMTPY